MRLIDADALKTNCDIMVGDATIGIRDYVMFHEIDSAPTIDAVEERPTGKWTMICNTVIENQNGYITEWECDQCHEHQLIASKFCPNCGADMRGEDDERFNQQTGYIESNQRIWKP